MTTRDGHHPATVGSVDERQAYALAHPLNAASGSLDALAALRADTPLAGGNLLRSILAVDR